MRHSIICDRPWRGQVAYIVVLLFALAALVGTSRGQTIVGFEDLSLSGSGCHSGPTGSYWNGSDGSRGFTSGGAYFNNSYDQAYGAWSGWSYSNVNDTTDPGVSNLTRPTREPASAAPGITPLAMGVPVVNGSTAACCQRLRSPTEWRFSPRCLPTRLMRRSRCSTGTGSLSNSDLMIGSS